MKSFLSHSGLLNGEETQTSSVFTLLLMHKLFPTNGIASTQPELGHGDTQTPVGNQPVVLDNQQFSAVRIMVAEILPREKMCAVIPAKEVADLDLNYICPAQISGKCSKNEQVWQCREELGHTGVPVFA